MARVAVQLTNFTGGEVSPRLDGRNDLGKYNSACKTLTNMIVYPHGSASRRPGTKFVKEVKDSTKQTRLIPFQFSTTQTYILEFGNQYIRFYKNGGQIYLSSVAYELSTTYLEADLNNLKFAQSADVMYICHQNYPVKKLSRTGDTSWTLTNVAFTNGPFNTHNITTTTLTPNASTVGSSVTVTASSITGINAGAGFNANDVERLILLNKGQIKITSITNTTTAVGTISVALTGTTASADWSLGAWSKTTGYPSCVTFFQQRLAFAGNNEQPQTIWFSKSGDYENFDENYYGTVSDDDAIIYTIASNEVNAIRYLSSTRVLLILTVGGEFSCSGGGTDNPITPTNITITKQSNHGCANADAIAVANVTLFIQRAKRKIRELAYNFTVDGYVSPDLTILAEHISDTGINQMSYQQEPNQIIWCTKTNGVLIGLTYQREQQVVAWHKHIFGGSFGSGNSVCESIATIPTDNNEYETWVIVKRTINGVTKRYVEYLNTFDFDETDNKTFNFLDAQLSYSGSAATIISGLSHLEGQTVSILADGSVHPNRVVTSGSITLARSASNVKVGLPYTSILQTMRIDAGGQDGTSQAKTKRIYEVTVRLYQSIGVEVGPDLNNMEEIPFRSSADLMDQPIPVYTGDKPIEFRGNYETDGYIFVRQAEPLPLTVLSLYPRLVTNDG